MIVILVWAYSNMLPNSTEVNAYSKDTKIPCRTLYCTGMTKHTQNYCMETIAEHAGYNHMIQHRKIKWQQWPCLEQTSG